MLILLRALLQYQPFINASSINIQLILLLPPIYLTYTASEYLFSKGEKKKICALISVCHVMYVPRYLL